MAAPTLKSNAEDQKVCKKKNLSWLFGADRKIRPSGSMTLGRIFYPHLTSIEDSSILFQAETSDFLIWYARMKTHLS